MIIVINVFERWTYQGRMNNVHVILTKNVRKRLYSNIFLFFFLDKGVYTVRVCVNYGLMTHKNKNSGIYYRNWSFKLSNTLLAF